MGKAYFVSGIDTGIGKTAVTGLMARWLASQRCDVVTVKMVQTGNDGFSEDLDMHRAIMGAGKFREDLEGLTAPQIFKFPSSPLLAASLEGKTVDADEIARSVRLCAARHGVVLLESALAASERWPLVLVTCGRLGAINHTLLSLEAAKSRGMKVAGIVHNWCEGADPAIDRDAARSSLRYLAKWGFPQVVVRVPRFDMSGPYPEVDFSEVFA